MRKQITPTVERLFIGPLRDLVDTSFLLITSPASVAREFASQDGHQFARAVIYFVAAFSAAVILNKVALSVLSIDAIKEVQYWLIHVAMVLCIALLAALLAFAMQSAPVSLFLKMAFLAYGACYLIGNFMLAGASLTLFGLREVGYIPDFNVDMSLVRNYEKIANEVYRECVREHSILFDTLYHGFAATAFTALRYPLDGLYFLEHIFASVASVLFTILAYFGSERRRWASGLAAGLSSALIIAGIIIGDRAWGDHVARTTPSCDKQYIEDVYNRTGEDRARVLAEMYSRLLKGKQGPTKIFHLTDVEQHKRSLTLRWRVNERATDENRFADFMEQQRKKLVREYCNSDSRASDPSSEISEVWVFRYADTDLVETVVKSADQCRQ